MDDQTSPKVEYDNFGCNVIVQFTIVASEKLKLGLTLSAPFQISKNQFSGFQATNFFVAYNEKKFFEVDLNSCKLYKNIYICEPLLMVNEKLNLLEVLRMRLFNIYIKNFIIQEIIPGIYLYTTTKNITAEIFLNYEDFSGYMTLFGTGIIAMKVHCMLKLDKITIINSKKTFNLVDIDLLLPFSKQTDVKDVETEFFFSEGLLMPSNNILAYKKTDENVNKNECTNFD